MNPAARKDYARLVHGQQGVGQSNIKNAQHTTATDPLIGWHRCAAESVAGRRAESLKRQALGKHGEVE